jgi:hypothetical protein
MRKSRLKTQQSPSSRGGFRTGLVLKDGYIGKLLTNDNILAFPYSPSIIDNQYPINN